MKDYYRKANLKVRMKEGTTGITIPLTFVLNQLMYDKNYNFSDTGNEVYAIIDFKDQTVLFEQKVSRRALLNKKFNLKEKD